MDVKLKKNVFKCNFILLVFVFFGINKTFSQNQFSLGYNNGFKAGYCYNKGVGCISPLPPVPPVPNYPESFYNFQDGYNRGFIDGRGKASNIQTENQSPYGRKTYRPDIKPFTPNYELLNQNLSERDKNYQIQSRETRIYYSPKKLSLIEYLNIHWTTTKGITFYELSNFRPEEKNLNFNEFAALNAVKEYWSFNKYPWSAIKGVHDVKIIVINENNKIIEFKDGFANLDENNLIESVSYFDSFDMSNGFFIYKKERDLEGIKERPEIIFNFISGGNKVKNCRADLIVNSYKNLGMIGGEFKVIVLFINLLKQG
jgi:uncharacterized protein YkvS